MKDLILVHAFTTIFCLMQVGYSYNESVDSIIHMVRLRAKKSSEREQESVNCLESAYVSCMIYYF